MLIGNLAASPELRYTPNGVPVASFRMAVNRQWTNADGTKQEKSTWFRVTTWRKQAEIVSQYLEKGSKVMVIGEIEEPSVYTDRDGNQKASLEVTAQTVKFLSGKGDGADAGDGNEGGTKNGSAGRRPTARQEVPEEEIPF